MYKKIFFNEKPDDNGVEQLWRVSLSKDGTTKKESCEISHWMTREQAYNFAFATAFKYQIPIEVVTG